MKKVIIVIASLAFICLFAFEQQEAFAVARFQDLFSETAVLVCLYLFFLLCYIVVSPQRQAVSTEEAPSVSDEDNDKAAVLHFLSLLQEKGRLLDFAMDDIAPYKDEQVGQVARVVHQGVRDALSETLEVSPLHEGKEGDTISLGAESKPYEFRLLGKSGSQEAPFQGKVLHRGWRAVKVVLPKLNEQAGAKHNIVQPIEVELAS